MAPTSATSPTAGEVDGDSNVTTTKPSSRSTRAEREATPTEVPSGEVAVEFVGTPPYGREFHRERNIDSKSWGKVGVDAKKMTWDESNNWTVNVPSDNEALLEYFRKSGSGFKVHE